MYHGYNMATAPLRPCLSYGCSKLVASGRCANHQRQYQRHVDEQRGSATQRGYNWTWQTIVRRKMREHPMCEQCGHMGSPDNPLTGDHIVPVSRSGQNTVDNCRILCRRCNSARGGRLAHE